MRNLKTSYMMLKVDYKLYMRCESFIETVSNQIEAFLLIIRFPCATQKLTNSNLYRDSKRWPLNSSSSTVDS